MVLSVLVAIVAAPALLGTQEAIRQSQSKEKREEHRARRCNLIASCIKSSPRSREINGRPIVLNDGKLWIDTSTSGGTPSGHPYAGYYLPYPDAAHEGLVTTITDAAPIMNWVYVDKDTYEVKYGVRLDAQPNLTGPFDCTRQDRRLTFDGWEGWCAVEEAPARWAVYFDRDDDGLRGKVAPGTRVLEIELWRREKRWRRDGGERVEDQTTKRAVDVREDAPVDEPVGEQPGLKPLGVGVPREETAPEQLSPFRLPESIFRDPPRPLFWGREMLPPRSPPRAYVPMGTPPGEHAVLPAPEPQVSVPKPQASASVDEAPLASSRVHAPPREAPAHKRPTPKLNRNSGTRAITQAHMFEARAFEQTPTTGSRFRGPVSRPLSSATASAYSNTPSHDGDEDFQTFAPPEASLLPPSMSPKLEKATLQPGAPLTASDPAVFARLSSGSSTASDLAVVKDKRTDLPSIKSKGYVKSGPANPPPKGPLPPLPGVFLGTGTRRKNSADRRASRFTPLNRKPSGRDSVRPPGAKDMTVPRQRGGPVSSQSQRVGSRESPVPPRNDSASSQSLRDEGSGSSPIPRQRKENASPQGQRSEDARPSPRPSATRTNTGPVRADRNRTTTSSLFREIGDLGGVSRDRSGSAASNASITRRSGLGLEDRQASPRRAVTVREPRRDESGRLGVGRDRVREAARGPARGGERESDRLF